MIRKNHSEYTFYEEVSINDKQEYLSVTLYLNHQSKTYNIVEDNEEGIFYRKRQGGIRKNMIMTKLVSEALQFAKEELNLPD